MIHYCQSL